MLPNITLSRNILSNKGVLGILHNSRGLEIARTFEPPFFDNMPDISCIPFGRYKCLKDKTGTHKYWKIIDVYGRENIEFHIGNYLKDTNGCILLGQDWAFLTNERTRKIEMGVSHSDLTFKKILQNNLLPDEFCLDIVS